MILNTLLGLGVMVCAVWLSEDEAAAWPFTVLLFAFAYRLA